MDQPTEAVPPPPHPVGADSAPPVPDSPVDTSRGASDAAQAALDALDGLESDIAAVEQALSSVDAIVTEAGQTGGESAAAALRAVVDTDRFGD